VARVRRRGSLRDRPSVRWSDSTVPPGGASLESVGHGRPGERRGHGGIGRTRRTIDRETRHSCEAFDHRARIERSTSLPCGRRSNREPDGGQIRQAMGGEGRLQYAGVGPGRGLSQTNMPRLRSSRLCSVGELRPDDTVEAIPHSGCAAGNGGCVVGTCLGNANHGLGARVVDSLRHGHSEPRSGTPCPLISSRELRPCRRALCEFSCGSVGRFGATGQS